MIIGVDAGALSITDERLKVGVYRVTYNLLRVLGVQDTKNEYRLYTFQPIPESTLSDFGPRMKNIVLKPTIGWFSYRLPFELYRHPVDAFLGLAQAMPRLSCRTIGCMYDIGFFYNPASYGTSAKRLMAQTDTLVRRSTRIVTISDASKRDVVATYHVALETVHVLYPGVDSRFSPRGPSFVAKRPYILFVGSLTKSKNIPEAIRAFSLFLKQSKEAYDFLLIGGDYWLDEQIQKTIDSLHIQDHIKLLGFVPDEQLPLYYRGARAFITTALREGFCLPVAEAMACGVPVVAGDRGALSEIIGNAGILTEAGNEVGLAKAIETVTGDTNKRKGFVRMAQERSQKYTWQAFGSGILNLLAVP